MNRSLVLVWGLMFSGTAHAACVWEGSASSFFRCLMDTSEVVDDNTGRLDGLEEAVWDLSDAMLTAGDVLSTVAGEGYALLVDIAPVGLTGLFSDLEGIPEGLLDGDDDTLSMLVCAEGEVAVFEGGGWVCGEASGVTMEWVSAEMSDLLARMEELEASSGAVGDGVLYGDYTIYNNVDLAGLIGYTEVTGELIIQASTLPSLVGLESLTSVGNNLTINDSRSLTSLEGLNSLTSVGGDLKITFNGDLTSFEGLNSLTSVGGYLNLESNVSLMSLEGLNGLTSVSEQVYIERNDSLTSLEGLNSLTSIGNNLSITSNVSLMSLEGLNSLTSIGGELAIGNNDSLTSLEGLDSLTSVGEHLIIIDNDSLSSLEGPDSLTSVGESLYIEYNLALCLSLVDAFASMLESWGWSDSLYSSGNDDGC
jgi:hypothetical protein